MSEVPREDAQEKGDGSAGGREPPTNSWRVAYVGFDTTKGMWFVQFRDEANADVGTYYGSSVKLNNGDAAQYDWKDPDNKPLWHIRERFFPDDLESFSIDPTGPSIALTFKGANEESERPPPSGFEYLLYAFHLTSRGAERAPMGFVEFYDGDGSLIERLDNRWIILEGVPRSTYGSYPKIRLRVERRDVGRIRITRTAVVIGK